MMKHQVWSIMRASVYVLFSILCFVSVAELSGWELIPTPKRKLEAWWPVLSDCASSISDEQLTQWAGRIPEGSWWFGEERSGKVHQAGVVVLGDGKMVRFCFVSHHHLPCLDLDCIDSLAVFRVEDLEIRTLGGFCCEVSFSEKQPKDLLGFIHLLSRFRKTEITNRRSPTP
jgi:hypothetical protein